MKMKTITLTVVLPLCFLFSTITAKPLFAITGKDNVGASEIVLDIDGDEVRTNQTYYVKACLLDGLTMAYKSYNELYVAQHFPVNLPLEFTLLKGGDVVPVSTDLFIKFAVSQCSGCSRWSYISSSSTFCVHGGQEKQLFQIVKAKGKFYKFALYNESKLVDVNIYNNPLTQMRNLCTSGETFHVEFVKGSNSATS
ncbi:hypothetical protein NMG60_11032128 [Bertholletia excelsa]